MKIFGWFGKGRREVASQLTAGGQDGNDVLGDYGMTRRTGDERLGLHRYLRASTFLNIGLLLVVLLEADIIRVLLPLKEVKPMVATVSMADDIVARVEQIPLDTPRADAIALRLAAGWIKTAFEVVPDWEQMNNRWGSSPAPKCAQEARSVAGRYDDELCTYMARHSSKEAYMAFLDFVSADGDQNGTSDAMDWVENGITRKVDFYMDPLRRGPDALEFRFWTIDSENGREVGRQHWVVNLRYTFNTEQRADATEQFLNPYAFKVTQFIPARTSEKAEEGR